MTYEGEYADNRLNGLIVKRYESGKVGEELKYENDMLMEVVSSKSENGSDKPKRWNGSGTGVYKPMGQSEAVVYFNGKRCV